MTTALALALALPSAALAGSGFARKVAIDPVSVACPTGGAEKGRVVVDVPVHYGDVTTDRDTALRGTKQRLEVDVQIVSPDSGKVLVSVRHVDKGLVAVGADKVDHVHRIVLTAKQSAVVQAYARSGALCGGRSLKSVLVKTKATQTVGAARTALRGAAAASQSATRTDEASVAATGKLGQVINGCAIRPFAVCVGVDLTGAKLQKAFLTGAVLQGATLTGADLTGAGLGAANLTQITATGKTSVFTNAVMTDANLAEANIQGATFTSANLTNSNLALAKTAGTNFTGATLDQSGIAFTNLTGTNFSSASLAGVSLAFSTVTNTICDGNTEVSGPPFYACQNGILVKTADR